MNFSLLDRRPIIVALAGPNGAGKTTFYHAYLRAAALRFVNADVLSRGLALEPYAAARLADRLRRQLVEERESFVFETVFSDPAGDKVRFLKEAADAGYTVVLCYIGISAVEISEERVALRATQGGHDVPVEKLRSRFSRTLANLKVAVCELPFVFVYDNDDLRTPFRQVAVFQDGRTVSLSEPLPEWLRSMLPPTLGD